MDFGFRNVVILSVQPSLFDLAVNKIIGRVQKTRPILKNELSFPRRRESRQGSSETVYVIEKKLDCRIKSGNDKREERRGCTA